MATVPQYEIGQVKDSPVSGGFQQIQTNSDAFGAGIAQANIQRGQVMNQLGDQAWQQAFKQRDKFDQAVLKDQDNQLQTFIREQMDDPGGYLSLTGKAALDQKAIIEKAIQERMKLLGKDVDQRILDQWKTVANQRIQTAMGRISSHSATQTTNYYNTVSDARIAGAVNDVVNNYENEAERAKYIKFGLNEVNQKIERVLGISPDTQDEAEMQTLAKFQMDFTSPAHTGIIEKLLQDNRYDAANTYYAINKAEIKPDAQLALQKAIESNTRDGQVADEVARIFNTPDITDTEMIQMAEQITDADLAAKVRQKLEHAQGYRDQETNQAEAEADDAALRLMTSEGYTETDQIPREIWNAMSSVGQANMTTNMRQTADRIRTEAYTKAKDNVYSLYTANRFDRNTPGPTVADILKMNGPDQLAFFDKREDDASREDTETEVDAYKAAKKLQVTGTLYKDMPSEITDALTGDAIQLLQDREKVNIERLETDAYNEGLALVAGGQVIPDALLFKMDGIQRLAIQKESVSFANRAEEVAYEKLLGHLLIPGNDLSSATDAGLTSGVSNLHLTNISNAENTTKQAQAKIDKEITDMKNYVKLLDMAQSDYEGFTAMWDAQKEELAGAISESNWKALDKMRQEPAYTKSVLTRNQMTLQTLVGLKKKEGTNKFLFTIGKSKSMSQILVDDSEDGDDARGFMADIDQRVADFSEMNDGRLPTDMDFKKILSDAASDRVFFENDKQRVPIGFISESERDEAYIKIDDQKYSLADNDVRDQIISYMRDQGPDVIITEQTIMQMYKEWTDGILSFELDVDL